MSSNKREIHSLDLKLTSLTRNEVRRANFAEISQPDLDTFKQILGKDGVCQNLETLHRYNTDCYATVKGQSNLLIYPKSTTEVSQILKYCNARNLAVTPQGGNTSLVGGSVPVFDEIILSMSRMDSDYYFDSLTGILRSQAGVTLRSLNEYVRKEGYIVPLDLAPDKLCQIGGNVATNAGGLRYFRYGSLRTTVVGMEAVMANGDVVDMMNCLKKDNTGYDLKQLLIGSEGTLGVITQVAIQCPLQPKSVACMLLGLKSFDVVLSAFRSAESYFHESLTCCEIMDAEAMFCVQENLGLENPILGKFEYFIVLEVSKLECGYPMKDLLDKYLTLLDPSIKTFIALAREEINKVWKLRRGIGMAVLGDGYAYKYDFSIPLDKFPELLGDIRSRVGSKVRRCCSFGHLGDSNIHLVVTDKEFSMEVIDLLEPFLYEWVESVRGSISAEHGIGFKERKYLKCSKSAAAIQLMKGIKDALDPKGILNPYKIFS